MNESQNPQTRQPPPAGGSAVIRAGKDISSPERDDLWSGKTTRHIRLVCTQSTLPKGGVS